MTTETNYRKHLLSCWCRHETSWRKGIRARRLRKAGVRRRRLSRQWQSPAAGSRLTTEGFS